MATLEQIIVDGANGVTQAPRMIHEIPAWQGLVLLLALGLTVLVWRRSRGWQVVALVAAAATVPGYLQVLVARADAPAKQAVLTDTVERLQQRYLQEARAALTGLPEGTCYEVARDAACIPYGGLHDGMARRLGSARRCMGGEPRRQRLLVTDCTATDVAVDLATP